MNGLTSTAGILGTSAAYNRFCIAVRVMEEVLAAAPEPARAIELARAAGCSAGMLTRICSNLERAGMLSPAKGLNDAWVTGPNADAVTLADILCSEIAALAERKGGRNYPGCPLDLETFVMQATIDINQIVLAQLRRFPLRRPPCHAISAA
jgi:DNA-binding IscR family transcriptional regulator